MTRCLAALLLVSCSASPLDFEGPRLPLCFNVDQEVREKLPHVYEAENYAAAAWNVELESPGVFLVCPRRIYFGDQAHGECRDSRPSLSGNVCLVESMVDRMLPLDASCDPKRQEYYLGTLLANSLGLAFDVQGTEGVMANPPEPCSLALPSEDQIEEARSNR